mmetsp:Transcript_18733/g.34931  ORF Transcript_18733/g.34931 Transcript_18733/m.34931 type:complete len:550 (+) Transcript_18733:88-1737(+)
MEDNPFASPQGKVYSGDNVTPSQSPHPLTLREQAAQRTNSTTMSAVYATTPTSTTSSSSPHPLAHSSTSSSGSSSTARGETPEDSARKARKEWQQHGSGVTQAHEDIRRRDEERPGTVTARLLSAETRKDVTGKKYTSYVLSVRLANNQVLQLEHRYSEFYKLNESFNNHAIRLGAVFPKKHLAGRIGNWTPSLRWAPEKHEELIQYRKVQLDVWLVCVCERFNLGDLPHSLQRSVYEFLTLSDRPPCELENVADDLNSVRWNNPISFTLGSSIRQACRIVEDMCMPQSMLGAGTLWKETDQSIPLDLLHCAKGLIFLTVVKAGLVVSGRVGTGLLIARVDEPQNWSAPCALGTIGMGWGALAGADVTHYLVVLTKQEAVESMLSSGTVTLGSELGVSVGPVGRTSQVSTSADHSEWTLHPAYSYAHSQGLFIGVSLEGSILSMRHDVNAKFYGRAGLSGEQILDLPPPKAAEPLYASLERAMAAEIPEDAFRPSQLFQDNENAKGASRRVANYSANTSSCSANAAAPAFDTYGRVSVTPSATGQVYPT